MSWLTRWFDERLGTHALYEALFARKIPRLGSFVGWFYTLGAVAVFLFVLQAVTGMALAFNYAASPDHAYDAVVYISKNLPLGDVVRGLHHWGASAMVVVVVLHLLVGFVFASYKYPRETTWVTGVFLLLVVLLFGFTGYLLPWNERAYWATTVGTNIAAETPVVGAYLGRLLRGGESVGAQTLARFYALHTLVLPALLLVFVAVHLFMVVRQGVSAPPARRARLAYDDLDAERRAETESYHALKEAGEPFFPNYLAKDAVAVVVGFAIVAFLASRYPPEIGTYPDPADTNYNPRPEWYFLFLFQFLKFFPGWLEPVAAVVLPSLVVVLLILWPFVDRRLYRHPFDRPWAVMAALATVAGIAWLTVTGANSPALSPYVPEPVIVLNGKRLFRDLRCGYCHSINGRGGGFCPDLALATHLSHDQAWIEQHLSNPASSIAPGSPMVGLLPAQVKALAAYIEELRGGGPYGPDAPQLFATYCAICHRLRGSGGAVGPDLSEIGLVRTRTFIHIYTENPKAILGTAKMPGFVRPAGPLTHRQVEDLARFLAVQRGSVSTGDQKKPQGGTGAGPAMPPGL